MLYLVPTPIGNLEDITLRALRILKEVDIIACEDTRTSGFLLAHYQISTPKTSFHAHNENTKAQELLKRMQDGETVALITDAGSPGISDPGFSLVRLCVAQGVKVEALPGATAFVPALTTSGLSTDRFVFEGFLPHKKGRQTRLKALETETRTMVFYESPHRLLKFLLELQAVVGADRKACIAREITKKFEEIKTASLAELYHYFTTEGKIKGEFVVLVEGKTEKVSGKNKYNNKEIEETI